MLSEREKLYNFKYLKSGTWKIGLWTFIPCELNEMHDLFKVLDSTKGYRNHKKSEAKATDDFPIITKYDLWQYLDRKNKD